MKKYIARMSSRAMLLGLGVLAIWIFFLLQHELFGYKVFKENIYQIFFLSTLGILALICGAFLVNISTNIARIADAGESIIENKEPKKIKHALIGFAGVLILSMITAKFLNYKSNQWINIKILKEYEDLSLRYKNTVAKIFQDVRHPSEWKEVHRRLRFLENKKDDFRSIHLILFELYDGHVNYKEISSKYLAKDKYIYRLTDYRCSQAECDILDEAYKGALKEKKILNIHQDQYTLIVPFYKSKNYALVLKRFQKYGKIGN